MGLFTTPKPLITKEEKMKAMNEIHSARDENGNHLFNKDHHKYIDQELESHMDADAPGQYPGISPDEKAVVMGEMKKPGPLEQDTQRRFGIRYGFNEKQVDFVEKVFDKYLKK